jgi:hypothetical protein
LSDPGPQAFGFLTSARAVYLAGKLIFAILLLVTLTIFGSRPNNNIKKPSVAMDILNGKKLKDETPYPVGVSTR